MKQQLLDLGVTEEQADKILGLIKPIQEELEGLKPKEKTQAEIELEERIKALEDRERAIAEQEKATAFRNSVKEKGIAEELIPFLNAEVDLEQLSGVMKELQLASSFEPNVPRSEPSGITKEQFQKMGYTERMQLFETNKALYDKLSE